MKEQGTEEKSTSKQAGVIRTHERGTGISVPRPSYQALYTSSVTRQMRSRKMAVRDLTAGIRTSC